MAEKRRVQVQGLGGAVPSLQSAIPGSIGRTRTQVQQATPWQESKLGQLSQVLGVTVAGVSELKQIGEQQIQRDIEDLASKSPEELDKINRNVDGAFDKLVRKGGLRWFASPVNQERTQKALGALMHDEYERELRKRVEDPKNFKANVEDLIKDSKEALSEKYTTLNNSAVRGGFENAIRDTTNRYTLAHDSLKTGQARQEVKLAGKSILYNATKYGIESDVIDKWWTENEGSLTPPELIKLIEDVTLTHAAEGNDDAVDAWLDFATTNLKIGTAKLGVDPESPEDDVFGTASTEVSRIKEEAERLIKAAEAGDKGEAALLLTELDATVTEAAYALTIEGQTEFQLSDGTVVTSTNELSKWAFQQGQDSGNPYAQGSQLIGRIKNSIESVRALPEETQGINLWSTERSMTGGVQANMQEVSNEILLNDKYAIEDVMSGEKKFNPAYSIIANELQKKYLNKSIDKATEISIGSYEVEGELITNANKDRRIKDLRFFNQKFTEEYKEELIDVLNNRQTRADAIRKVEKGDEGTASYIDSSQELDDKVSGFLSFQGLPFYPRDNFYDIEEKIKEGDFEGAKEISETFNKTVYRREMKKDVMVNPVKDAIAQAQSMTLSLKEKEIARKKLLIYAVASKGADFYNAASIKRGFVNIEGTEIKIENKKALQDLSLIYPMISKARLKELSEQTNPDVTDILDLYNALFGTNYGDDDEQGRKAVIEFIEKTKTLYE